MSVRLLPGLLAFVLLALAGAAMAGEDTRDIKDWHAECRPDGYCAATASAQADSSAGAVLRVGRHARQSYWELSITPVAAPDPLAAFTASVDGAGIGFRSPDEVGAYGAPDDFYFIGPKAQILMDRLMPGRQMSVSFTDTSARPHTALFSLAGLTAALIWIDDRQHRIGSERVAEVPPYGLVPVGPDAPPAPVPQALIDFHRTQADCDPFETLPSGRDIVAGALDAGQVLYLLPCSAGAYNVRFRAYLGRGGDFEPLYFATYSDHFGWAGTPYLVNPDFDPANLTLSMFDKARAIADCGATAQWQWVDGGFRLVSYRYRSACDGDHPGDFPVVYARDPAAMEPEDRD